MRISQHGGPGVTGMLVRYHRLSRRRTRNCVGHCRHHLHVRMHASACDVLTDTMAQVMTTVHAQTSATFARCWLSILTQLLAVSPIRCNPVAQGEQKDNLLGGSNEWHRAHVFFFFSTLKKKHSAETMSTKQVLTCVALQAT